MCHRASVYVQKHVLLYFTFGLYVCLEERTWGIHVRRITKMINRLSSRNGGKKKIAPLFDFTMLITTWISYITIAAEYPIRKSVLTPHIAFAEWLLFNSGKYMENGNMVLTITITAVGKMYSEVYWKCNRALTWIFHFWWLFLFLDIVYSKETYTKKFEKISGENSHLFNYVIT